MTLTPIWRIAIPFALGLVFGVGGAQLLFHQYSLRTYEDCVLNGLRGVTVSNVGAVITSACRSKFPESGSAASARRTLDWAHLAKLTGRAGLQYDRYQGNIYNGNDDVTVTDVDISVVVSRGRDTTSRVYRSTLDIPPL